MDRLHFAAWVNAAWRKVAAVIEAATRFHDDCGHRGTYGEDVDSCDDVCRAVGQIPPDVVAFALETVRTARC